MASKEEIEQFTTSGGVHETIPLHKDIPHLTIQEYYPDKGMGFSLQLEAVQDPNDTNNWIAQYTEFGPSWSSEAIRIFQKLELEYDPGPAHQYLYARNLRNVRIEREPPDDWEIEKFLLAKLQGGQLLVWTYWDNPTLGKYALGYSWPGC